jgi:hypothetical protein
LKPTPTLVTFSGDESVELSNCYIFRDSMAHKAQVSIATGISFTEHPHLILFNIVVPGSKKNTFKLGIPFVEAMKLTRHAIIWNEDLYEYESCKLDVVRELFDKHIPDLVAASWTKEDVETIETLEATDELQEMVKQDLLKIAAVSMEAKKSE